MARNSRENRLLVRKKKPLYRICKEDLIAIGIVGSGSNGGDGSTGSNSSPTYLGIPNIIACCSKINCFKIIIS
jgi:hypothetical protein